VDLSGGQWRIDRDTYYYYSKQLTGWIGSDSTSFKASIVLTRAVCWLWEAWKTSGSPEKDSAGRHSLQLDGTPVTVLWRSSGGRLVGLVAGPKYQWNRWFDPVLDNPDFGSARINLRDRTGFVVFGEKTHVGVPETLRSASSTALPWDIVVTAADYEREMGSFIQRRRLMMAGLAAVALLVITSSYLIARAVSRELAAARLQSDFVSAVSHEFRTPLTSMRQFTEMLVEDDNLPPEKRRSFYAAQERATRRLSRLVESLLDFGRMEAGARPYRLEPLDAGHLVRTVVEEFRREIACNGFAIDCTLPGDRTVVRGDREALAQALWNILDNAVKYSGGSRTVRVGLEEGSYVEIRVRDEGYGIHPSERDQILRKFTRGSAARAHGIKGTGIGLAMVKHILDAHGGKLLIESEPGKGSTFTIQLPVGG
jgi:signal transduction histidine kinase